MKEAIMKNLEHWYGQMIKELNNLPEKLEEMGRSCLDRYGSAAG